MDYKFFISYCDEEYNSVAPIVEAIEYNKCNLNIKCWFQRKSSIDDFLTSIRKGIKESNFFLCFISHKSLQSYWVDREIDLAISKYKKDSSYKMLPIVMDALDEDEEEQVLGLFGRKNRIYKNNHNDQDSLILNVIAKLNIQTDESSRIPSKYTGDELIEIERLKLQNEYLNKIASPYLDKIFSLYSCPTVLDIGCADGLNIKLRLKGRKYSSLLGLDKNYKKISIAQNTYTSEKDEFLACDIESENFDLLLSQYLNNQHKNGFDVIHIAAVLMHMRKPDEFLKRIYNFLSPGGTIFIQDEDDAFNVSYPRNKYIESCLYIWKHSIESGDRSMGRKIPCLLADSGFININLLSSTVTSLDFNGENRKELWDIYYNSDLWVTDSPSYFDNIEAYEKYMKYKENYDLLKKKYFDGEFFITLGILFFSAQKPI